MNDPGTPDPVRAAGPPTVTEDPGARRTLLVLDPAGAAKHERIPVTWHDLEQNRRVVWCRTPSGGALAEAEAILRQDEGVRPLTDIVAGGPVGREALRLAHDHPGAVRAVLLVDPGAETTVEAGNAAAVNEKWLREQGPLVAAVRDAGIEVEVVAESEGGPRDRIPAPLPLGHPDVVAAVTAALDTLPAVRRPDQ
jgi:pimeloyl-ACP methyl ester carboxylesterase